MIYLSYAANQTTQSASTVCKNFRNFFWFNLDCWWKNSYWSQVWILILSSTKSDGAILKSLLKIKNSLIWFRTWEYENPYLTPIRILSSAVKIESKKNSKIFANGWSALACLIGSIRKVDHLVLMVMINDRCCM